jgi:hypothetical protein
MKLFETFYRLRSETALIKKNCRLMVFILLFVCELQVTAPRTTTVAAVKSRNR